MLTVYLTHAQLLFMRFCASELTVTSDCICYDSLPSQYSAHEDFFLFSANEPIPGHKLQNLSAPEMRRGLGTLYK